MKVIGPRDWKTNLIYRVADLKIPDTVTIVCLTTDSTFLYRLKLLRAAVERGDTIYIFSLTSEAELRNNPYVQRVIQDHPVSFVQGTKEVLHDRLRADFGPR